jgi:predicted enzyme related to lactoylglutathione lyase
MNRIVKWPSRGTAVAVLRAIAMALATGPVSAMALTSAAQGASPVVSLNAARVGAKDAASVAKFYETAFGLQEVRRFEFPGGVEILMNFGATAAAAKANSGAEIVVMHRDSDEAQDTIPHLIFTVTDINATVAALQAAGGRMDSQPKEFGKSGIMIGIAVDPAGNRIEMIQQAKK